MQHQPNVTALTKQLVANITFFTVILVLFVHFQLLVVMMIRSCSGFVTFVKASMRGQRVFFALMTRKRCTRFVLMTFLSISWIGERERY